MVGVEEMVSFKNLDEESKKRIINLWKKMNETDKTHFVNQVAITLSVLGPENGGKKQIADVMKKLIDDGAENLADFGIYMRAGLKNLDRKERRAVNIVDNYRMKYNLPNMPSKPII